jgi:hypothetical protein
VSLWDGLPDREYKNPDEAIQDVTGSGEMLIYSPDPVGQRDAQIRPYVGFVMDCVTPSTSRAFVLVLTQARSTDRGVVHTWQWRRLYALAEV